MCGRCERESEKATRSLRYWFKLLVATHIYNNHVSVRSSLVWCIMNELCLAWLGRVMFEFLSELLPFIAHILSNRLRRLFYLLLTCYAVHHRNRAPFKMIIDFIILDRTTYLLVATRIYSLGMKSWNFIVWRFDFIIDPCFVIRLEIHLKFSPIIKQERKIGRQRENYSPISLQRIFDKWVHFLKQIISWDLWNHLR